MDLGLVIATFYIFIWFLFLFSAAVWYSPEILIVGIVIGWLLFLPVVALRYFLDKSKKKQS